MDLQVRQDENFQRLEWRTERVGWVVIGLVVLAGLVGLLGTGPFSWASATSPEGLVTVQWQRMAHHEADDSLLITFSPDAVADGMVTAELTGTWLHGIDLAGISPEPAEQRLVPRGVVLEFPVERADSDLAVQLTFRPQQYGRLGGQVSVGADSASFAQFVLP